MKISGFNKLTLLDYPGKMAAIIFTQGCNFKCGFCQNSDLIKCNDALLNVDDILAYLEKRKNILEGVVISGGEPTIQNDLLDFIKKIKSMGYKIKLDTNGSNPDVLKKIIDNHLVDYIAMDIKNIFNKYANIIGFNNYDPNKVLESINLIKESGIAHEFRTTIIKNCHSEEDIRKIYDYLGKNEVYILQNFEDSEGVLDKHLESFPKDELINLKSSITMNFPNLQVRGI